LPPELQRHAFHVSGRLAHDDLADLRAAGERDLVDVGMTHDRRSGAFAVPGHDVDDARRHADLIECSASARMVRRLLAWLQHARAPRRQARRQLPRGHQQRKFHGMICRDADRLLERRLIALSGTGLTCPVIFVARPP
jgi:hypothetical protein